MQPDALSYIFGFAAGFLACGLAVYLMNWR